MIKHFTLFATLNERKEKYISKLVLNKNLFGIVHDSVHWVPLTRDCPEVGTTPTEHAWIPQGTLVHLCSVSSGRRRTLPLLSPLRSKDSRVRPTTMQLTSSSSSSSLSSPSSTTTRTNSIDRFSVIWQCNDDYLIPREELHFGLVGQKLPPVDSSIGVCVYQSELQTQPLHVFLCCVAMDAFKSQKLFKGNLVTLQRQQHFSGP